MATVLDFSLLKQFSDIFAWLLVFVVIYALLHKVDIFQGSSRGISALIAIAVTVLIMSTGGTADVIRGTLPWFVIAAFFILFMLVLTGFMGIPTGDVVSAFAGKGAIWWVFTILIIGMVISLVAGGQFSRGDSQIDPVTGEEIHTPGKTVINILTDSKVLGLILILGISAIAIALMAGAPQILLEH